MDDDKEAEARIASLQRRVADTEAALGEQERALAVVREEMQEALRERNRALEELREALRERSRALERREEKIRLMHARVAQAAHQARGRINLDVGGRVFGFTTDTLAKYPESYFGRLVSGRWELEGKKRGADEVETMFIERSYRPFKYIADFLMYDRLDVELSETDRNALLDECDYYGLDELSKLIPPPQKKQKTVGWSFVAMEDHFHRVGSTYSCTSKERHASMIGEETWESGVHQWTVRVDNGKDIWLGVCQREDGTILHSHWTEFKTGDMATIVFDADARRMEIRWTNADGTEGSDLYEDIESTLRHAYCSLEPGGQITLVETS